MPKLHPLRPADVTEEQPINIGDRAIENLAYIRETMERSTHFTAVPGYGGMLMGVTAIAAAYIANNTLDWLATWLVEACLAFAIGMLAMWQKSKIAGQSLTSAPARKFALGFAPPLIAGAVVTFGLWRYGQFAIMAPVWMVIYGTAVITGGAFSVKIVPVMGWLFMAAGAAAFMMPAAYGNYFMAASFGLLHIVFGAVIARRYGG